MFKVDLYTAIYTRRDVRSFRTDPVPDSLLIRILDAAHHAGSVGFMQPWNFVVVRSPDLKKRVFDSFAQGERASRRELCRGAAVTLRFVEAGWDPRGPGEPRGHLRPQPQGSRGLGTRHNARNRPL